MSARCFAIAALVACGGEELPGPGAQTAGAFAVEDAEACAEACHLANEGFAPYGGAAARPPGDESLEFARSDPSGAPAPPRRRCEAFEYDANARRCSLRRGIAPFSPGAGAQGAEPAGRAWAAVGPSRLWLLLGN